jgi:hypothetical protein
MTRATEERLRWLASTPSGSSRLTPVEQAAIRTVLDEHDALLGGCLAFLYGWDGHLAQVRAAVSLVRGESR